jgi:hypothetical protein
MPSFPICISYRFDVIDVCLFVCLFVILPLSLVYKMYVLLSAEVGEVYEYTKLYDKHF